MSEAAPDFRKGRIDYSDFPREASYISVGDVDAAYKQGLRDGAEPAEASNRRLRSRLTTAEATIAGMQRAISAEIAATEASTSEEALPTPAINGAAHAPLESTTHTEEADPDLTDTVELAPVPVMAETTAWSRSEDWA